MRLRKPIYLFSVFLASIFLGEVAIMFILSHIQYKNTVIIMFADALTLSALTAPLIYFFLYKPMHNQNELLRQASAELETHRRNLQDLVENRDEELRKINQRLRQQIAERDRIDEMLMTLSLAVAQSPSIVMITDPAGKITYVNPEFTRVTGFAEKEILGRNATTLGSDNPAYRIREMWEMLLAGNSWRGEFLNRCKDGTTYCETAMISPIRDAENRVIGYLKTATDETQRKMAEESLERNYQFQAVLNHILRLSLLENDLETQLHGVLECILFIPFLEVEPRGAILAADAGTASLSMVAQIGVSDEAGSPCRQDQSGHCLCGRAAHEKTVVYSNVCGTPHTVDATVHGHYCVPLVSMNETLGVLCLFLGAGHKRNDLEDQFLRAAGDVIAGIIRQHRTVSEAESLRRQYHHAQKMEAIGVLAGGIAHDFNNMLTGIQGNAELGLMTLKRPSTAMPIEEFLTQIITISQRAAELTRQLLLFSRKQPVRLEPVDLNEIIESMLKMLSRLIGDQVALKIDLDANMPRIMADRGSMDQMLMNLVVNARDALPDGGDIRITTRCLNDDTSQRIIRVTVSDSGIGMDEETRQHIFEPFFTTKEQGKGTGLGLAVVYGIVQQHNGQISVESSPGHGAVFTMNFPALREHFEQITDTGEAAPLHSGSEHILLVEDDEFVSVTTRMMLEAAGYRISAASRLDAAITLIEKAGDLYDLIITDVMLPDGNGLDLAERACARSNPVPVLLISGHIGDPMRWKTIKSMGIPFIQKPFGVRKLLESVKIILHGE